MKLTSKQWQRVIEADNKPIDKEAVNNFKQSIAKFDKNKIKIIEVENGKRNSNH